MILDAFRPERPNELNWNLLLGFRADSGVWGTQTHTAEEMKFRKTPGIYTNTEYEYRMKYEKYTD
jgi:hypothetical protein